MIVDTHPHPFWHGRDDAGLVRDMDEHGIDLAWLLTWEIPAGQDNDFFHGVLNPVHFDKDQHKGIPLADILAATRAFPKRFIPGYCPNPETGRAPDLFEAAYNIHGVRVCGEWKFRMLFDDPRCIELFRRAGKLACPVVLHLDVPYLPKAGIQTYYPQWYGGTVDNLQRALEQCPDTKFIGHAPGFWREISGDAPQCEQVYPTGPIAPSGRIPALLDAYPNLYADLSAGSALGALKRDLDWTKDFLIRYADRLLFGRDIYGGDLLTFLRSLDLPEPVSNKILGENALALVKIGNTIR